MKNNINRHHFKYRSLESYSIIVLFGIYLAFSSSIVYAKSDVDTWKILQEKSNQASAAELREISAVEEGSKGNVYFVRIFKGFIPLPTRYTLLADTKEPLEFNSMAEIPAMQSFNVFGTINMGKCGEWSIEFQHRKHAKLMSTETLYGLTVKTYEPNIRLKIKAADVFITDGFECLTMLDYDTSLWRAMLDFYSTHRDLQPSN